MTLLVQVFLVISVIASGAAVVEMLVALRWIRSKTQWSALFFPSGAFFVMALTHFLDLWSVEMHSNQDLILSVITVFLSIGAVGGVTALIRSLRQQQERDDESTFLRIRYQRLFKQNDLPIIVSEAESLRIVDANAAAADMFELPIETLLTRTVEELGIEEYSDELSVPARLEDRTAPGLRLRAPSGAVRELLIHRSVAGLGQTHLNYDIIEEVTERNAARRALLEQKDLMAHLAEHDPLTQLPNRRVLDAALEHAVARTRRGTPAALLFIDVDEFKSVNDSEGHQAGDEVLKGIATMISGEVRAADVVARIGGDEFAVLLEVTALPEARVMAERLLEAMRETYPRLGLSIGVADVGRAGTAVEAIGRADNLMYEAKTAGKNRVVVDAHAQDEEAPAG